MKFKTGQILAQFLSFVFILLILSISFVNFCYASSKGITLPLPHDGKIRLYSYHNNEFLDIAYLNQKREWLEDAYEKINQFARSRGDQLVGQIDKRLVELADHLQDHFKVDTFEVICGYRSPEFNKKLKEEGHNVANESFHTKGLAMDIHIDEIKEDTIRDYLLSLQLGGVGYYGDKLMIHMDFGPVRQWHSGSYRENTGIGIFNKENPVQIRTTKLFYALSDSQDIIVDQYYKKTTGTYLVLEKFHRGKWVICPLANFKISDQRVHLTDSIKQTIVLEPLLKLIKDMSPYGKFRWRYEGGKLWQNSNEFYVKKM